MAPYVPVEGSARPTGPLFNAVPSFDAKDPNCPSLPELTKSSKTPVVVRGAAAQWAARLWTFDALAERAEEGGALKAPLQNGLIEQGDTQPKQYFNAGPYLRDLARQEAELAKRGVRGVGLLPQDSPDACAMSRGEAVPLRWDWLASRKADKLYLGHWDMFTHFPEKRAEAPGPEQWPRHTWVYDFVWVGPAHTVTGLHYDVPDNWFTQVRGYKELILFPQSQAPLLPLNDKYDPGGYPCAIDITDVAQMPPEQRRLFEQARGWYVRLGPGDSLFVPKRTFHAVVSLTPSISISAFGHSPADLVTGGVPLEVRDFLHRIGLWRWGSCSCHEHSAARPLAGPCAVLGIGAALVAGLAYSWGRRSR